MRIGVHGAEFVEVEEPAVFTDPLDAAAVIQKLEKNRSFGVQLDGDGGDEQHRREDRKTKQRTDDIEDPFGDFSPAVERRRFEFDHGNIAPGLGVDVRLLHFQQIRNEVERDVMFPAKGQEVAAFVMAEIRFGLYDLFDVIFPEEVVEVVQGPEIMKMFFVLSFLAVDIANDMITDVFGEFSGEPSGDGGVSDEKYGFFADAGLERQVLDDADEQSAPGDEDDRKEPGVDDGQTGEGEGPDKEEVGNDGHEPHRRGDNDLFDLPADAEGGFQGVHSPQRENQHEENRGDDAETDVFIQGREGADVKRQVDPRNESADGTNAICQQKGEQRHQKIRRDADDAKCDFGGFHA